MARDLFTSVEVFHKEVLCQESHVTVVALPIRHSGCITRALKHDRLCRRVDVRTEVLSDYAFSRGDFDFWLVACDGEVVYDHAGKCRVGVAARRRLAHVILQAVATVEEFTDVTSNVVGEDEATTGVLIDELGHVKDEFVENDELATIGQGLLEDFS